jgi:hypothetical protein
MGEMRTAYKLLVGNSEGKRPLKRPRRIWEDNIKMDLSDMDFDGVDWVHLAQDMIRWRVLVNTIINRFVP